MGRINAGDDLLSGIAKMTEGNSEAAVFIGKILGEENGYSDIFLLDDLGIYGSDLARFGKYVCKEQDMGLMKQIFSDLSRGYLSEESLKEHIRFEKPFEYLSAVKAVSKEGVREFESGSSEVATRESKDSLLSKIARARKFTGTEQGNRDQKKIVKGR